MAEAEETRPSAQDASKSGESGEPGSYDFIAKALENGARVDDARRVLGSQKSGAARSGAPDTANGFPFDAPPGTTGETPTVETTGSNLGSPFNEAGPSAERTASGGAQDRLQGHATPPRRKSVQFIRDMADVSPHTTRNPDAAAAGDKPEKPGHQRQGSKIMQKIRAIASPMNASTHGRSISTAGADGQGDEMASPPVQSAISGNDADGELSANEDSPVIARRPKKRRMRSSGAVESYTAPNTPHRSSFFKSLSPDRPSPGGYEQNGLVRRATMPEMQDESGRQGMSEDEGRAHLARKTGWKRAGSAFFANQSQPSTDRRRGSSGEGDRTRPLNLRRITEAFTGTENSPSPFRKQADAGQQRWRQLKQGLKLMGQKRREENRIDYAKSAELMAELLAGSPAALIVASQFQRDEREKRKVPVLLEQLKIKIMESQRREDTADRHQIFRIELEYGSGLMRMKWTIYRSLRDFVNLHVRYKLQEKTHKYSHKGENPARSKLPRFPKTAFPYLRGVRGLAEDDDEEEDETAIEESAREEPPTPGLKGKQRRKSLAARRKSSSGALDVESGAISGAEGGTSSAQARDLYAERQRKKLEQYLREMIRFLIFRAGSNRLCRFLELSAMGVKLGAEGGYHGKEGNLTLQSGKGSDFRKKPWPTQFSIHRKKTMWYLVRHSYVVCVDSPEEMNIYDVLLVDSDFDVQTGRPRIRDQKGAKEKARTAKDSAAHPHHLLRLSNSERKLKFLAKNERQLQQFEESINFMKTLTPWSKPHRFDSFAPVRTNVFAQFLVDARDYMWNVSRAISMAQDVIYIHDWWLSPELYMRRPAAISHKWRLDRLLQRKAQEGVKVFVIMYRNINSAIPIDSEYSKFALLDLHPRIQVQRSPNQVRQNVFFWAHHEKLCVVDHTIAFCGGVDLCFGRWDTPDHSVTDDKPTGFEAPHLPKDADNCQRWPGKDYSNPRVLDFFKLDEPYGEMYDRSKVARMPWHDIGMQIVGQPARDLSRHFVQRWNYILRQRTPSRPTPFLLPPPDFNPGEVEAMGLEGTCTVQMLRSASEWSIGTPGKVEHSILNAYMKLIETSDHFVYMENQFFITSCVVEGTRIHNGVGDALVDRIIRAYQNGEDWMAVIVIPLMPGFQNTVDAQDGTSIRLIMQCQYRSICRGPSSIFKRLEAVGINPEKYIQFYSLRAWGKIGHDKALVTEQLYIHAKCMVVDDRHAIIGSANINERSMLGNRDSEVAAMVFDNDMIDSTMAGRPYKVGRFPHSLRMRLMREHLGIDVDEIAERERGETHDIYHETDADDASFVSGPSLDESTREKVIATRHKAQDDLLSKLELHSFNHDASDAQADSPFIKTSKKVTADSRVTGTDWHKNDVEGHGFDKMYIQESTPGILARDSAIVKGDREVLINNVDSEGRGSLDVPKKRLGGDTKQGKRNHNHKYAGTKLPPIPPRLHTVEMGLTLLSQLPPLPVTDDTDIGGPALRHQFSKDSLRPIIANMQMPIVEDDCMRDPLNHTFIEGTWKTVAENNTKLFRNVFRCMPDNEVTTWKEYEAFASYNERFSQSQGLSSSTSPANKKAQEARGKTGPPGTMSSNPGASVTSLNRNGTATSDQNTERLNSFNNGKAASSIHSSSNTKVGNEHPPHSAEGQDPEKLGLNIEHKDTLEPPSTARTRVNFDASEPSNFLSPDFGTSEKDHAIDGDLSREDNLGSAKRRKRATTKSSGASRNADPLISKDDAEELLSLVKGRLVVWPYDWLMNEERGGKWLYSVDQMAPLEIYN